MQEISLCISGLSSLGVPGVPGVPWHPQILADQLTLSQPQNNSGTPGFSDLPTALYFHADLPSVPFFTVSWKSAMVYFDVYKIASDT